MSEKFENKDEAVDKNLGVETLEAPEFKTQPRNVEASNEDIRRAEELASQTLEQIHKMGAAELIKGKVESMPQNPSQERLFKNVGFDAESLEATKAEFSKLSSAEAYNKFQVLSLEKTVDFLKNASKDLAPSEKGEVSYLLRVINATLEAANMNKKGNALRPYSFLMDHANHKPDGYMAFDGLSKLYGKNGYDDRGFLARNLGSADVPYENFQKDLAEVLTDEQRVDIAKMAKEAERNTKNSGGAKAGITQTTMAAPIFSNKTVSELFSKN